MTFASLEDDAVELVLRYCYWPVRLFLSTCGETRKELSIEERDPPSLTGCAPVLQNKKNASIVVYAWILEEESAFALKVGHLLCILLHPKRKRSAAVSLR